MKKFTLSVFFILLSVFLFSQPGSQTGILTLDSYQPFQGYDETSVHNGKGEYQIFYDNLNGVFDKPFILVDGFDPNDDRNIASIYSGLIYNGGTNNFFDDMRNQGIDIVILNFPNYTRTDDATLIHGGADYIERNGLVLVQLLETLKTQLPIGKDFIIMGPSMGGLISRYALTYMEQNNMNHKTGLWFSFDSPHLGANIPISIQYALNYVAEYSDDPNLRASRDLALNNPAAKQMILDHYTAHLQQNHAYLQNTSIQLPTPAANFRSTFVSTMNALGFPTQTRNLAISNGSLIGTMVESPGVQMVNTTLDMGSGIYTQVRLHFTPAANISNFEIDYIRTTFFGFEVSLFSAVAASPSNSSGLDSAPGGTSELAVALGSSPNPTLVQLANALAVEKFSFIPTLSSLAVENPNWYTSITNETTTPFDAYIGPTINEPHVTLNSENIAFILNEINTHFLSIPDLTKNQLYVLLNNPSQDFISIKLISTEISEINLQLFNTSGQLINEKTFTNESEILTLGSPVKSGIYFMKLNMDGRIFVEKILIK